MGGRGSCTPSLPLYGGGNREQLRVRSTCRFVVTSVSRKVDMPLQLEESYLVQRPSTNP